MIRRKSVGSRGAALVEYVILVGLISIISIGAVFTLGERASSTFNEVATRIDIDPAPVGSGSSEEVRAGLLAPSGPVTDWYFDFDEDEAEANGTPSWVTNNSGVWAFDLDPILRHFPEGQSLYYDAVLYQDGTRTVSASGGCAYTLRPHSEFKRDPANDVGILGGIASAESGTSDCTPLTTQTFIYDGSVEGALVPVEVDSIEVYNRSRFCSGGATCIDGPLNFSIRFFVM